MSPKADKGIQRDKPPSTPRPALRAVAAVVLIALIALWLVLSSQHSGAATPVLLGGLVFSLACMYFSLVGKL